MEGVLLMNHGYIYDLTELVFFKKKYDKSLKIINSHFQDVSSVTLLVYMATCLSS